MNIEHRILNRGCALLVVAMVLVCGCSKPDKANILVRKQNQELRTQVEGLQRQHEADGATIKSLEQGNGTTPTLPNERVSQLFTVHGLQFGRLTGVDPDKANGIKVYVVPTDGAGEPIKAAGSFVVEAFDLGASGETRIGRCEFPLEQAAKQWFGRGLLYTYVLPCELSGTPSKAEVTVRVTFTDGLTGREFSGQQVIKVPQK